MIADDNQKMNENFWLSVVVIGRNEARRLPELFASLPEGPDIEWIYVDSRSGDNSVEIALAFGAKVFLVDEGSVYAPGTGRYIGSIEARGRWILYLDGDMVLRADFKAFLDRLKEEETRADQADSSRASDKPTVQDALPPETVGFVGHTRNLYLDRAGQVIGERDFVVLPKEETGPVESWGRYVHYHGGAVLYRRQAVLKAGNWNPAVYQLEEVELYSRINSLGGRLRGIDLPMADHYTPYLNPKDKLILNFLPQWREKKFYGAGQVVASRLRRKDLFKFICVYPYPFVVGAGLLTIPLVFAWPLFPLLFNLAIAVTIGLIKKKWYFYLVYLGNLLQILRGLNRYKPFKPQYQLVKRSE